MHNTTSFKSFKKCNDDDNNIKLSCDLMKTDWKTYLHNPEHNYTVNCTYYKTNPQLKLHKFNFTYLNYSYYKITHNALYCYVKENSEPINPLKPILTKENIIEISPRQGGSKNNKYLINKSKNNIFIIMNNKKKVIYIDNNKLYLLIDNKPIFINKKQLSTKNGEYYIKSI